MPRSFRTPCNFIISMATKKPLRYGLGRRKSARAQVTLTRAAGDRTVNGLPFASYFTTDTLQQTALQPLVLTSQNEVLGFRLKVQGGGKHAQADAVKLALARALVSIDEAWRKQLKDTGMLTRDPREKERKKYGLKRARRAPQFSKR